MKIALCQARVLALPNFNVSFEFETNACVHGLWVVLCQKGKLLAYFSKALSPKLLGLSIYEKEYMEILMVVDR